MRFVDEILGKKFQGNASTTYVTIEETNLPIGALQHIDLKTGDTVVLEVEITLSEPNINGFRGVVHTIRPKGYRTISGLESIEEEG